MTSNIQHKVVVVTCTGGGLGDSADGLLATWATSAVLEARRADRLGALALFEKHLA